MLVAGSGPRVAEAIGCDELAEVAGGAASGVCWVIAEPHPPDPIARRISALGTASRRRVTPSLSDQPLTLAGLAVSDVEGASKLTTTWVKPSEPASVVSIRRVLSSPRRVRSLALAASSSLVRASW